MGIAIYIKVHKLNLFQIVENLKEKPTISRIQRIKKMLKVNYFGKSREVRIVHKISTG